MYKNDYEEKKDENINWNFDIYSWYLLLNHYKIIF